MNKWRVIRDKDGNAITLECDGEPVLHIYTTMLANKRADEIVRLLNDYERLRAALHKITQIYDDHDMHDLTACHEMNRIAKEALSTTTEPTDAVKVEQFECPCCECEINAPEKVGTEEWRHKYFGAERPKAEGEW